MWGVFTTFWCTSTWPAKYMITPSQYVPQVLAILTFCPFPLHWQAWTYTRTVARGCFYDQEIQETASSCGVQMCPSQIPNIIDHAHSTCENFGSVIATVIDPCHYTERDQQTEILWWKNVPGSQEFRKSNVSISNTWVPTTALKLAREWC